MGEMDFKRFSLWEKLARHFGGADEGTQCWTQSLIRHGSRSCGPRHLRPLAGEGQ